MPNITCLLTMWWQYFPQTKPFPLQSILEAPFTFTYVHNLATSNPNNESLIYHENYSFTFSGGCRAIRLLVCSYKHITSNTRLSALVTLRLGTCTY
jgi:hypothetical protein